MAVVALTQAKILMGAYDVSGKHNQVSVDFSAEMLDATVFGMTTKANLPGLFDWQISGGGFWEVGSVDPAFGDQTYFNRIGGAETPLTVAPTGAAGETCYFLKALQPSYNFLGSV